MRPGPERLVEEIRDLIEVIRTADPSDAAAEEAAAAVRAVTDRLRPSVVDGVRMQAFLELDPAAVDSGLLTRSDFAMELVGMDPTDAFPYSPVAGLLNPIAPPCRLWCVKGDPYHEIAGSVTIGSAYAGPPDSVHGGVLAAILDEVLGGACGVNGIGGFTGTLSVRYRARSPLHEPLELSGRVSAVEGRKIHATGEVRHGDLVCAVGEGIFIRVDDDSDRS